MFCIYPIINIALVEPLIEEQLRYMCFLYEPNIVKIEWLAPLEVKITFDTIENAFEGAYHLRNEWSLRVQQECTF